MRRMVIPMESKWMLPELHNALKRDGAKHLWVAGNFNMMTTDSRSYFTDGKGYKACEVLEFVLRKSVSMSVCTTPPAYAVEIWDGEKFYCNIPDLDKSKLSYGKRLEDNVYLKGMREILQENNVERLYCVGMFTGRVEDNPLLLAETYDTNVSNKITDYMVSNGTVVEEGSGCSCTYYNDCIKDVVYEDGVFYSKE